MFVEYHGKSSKYQVENKHKVMPNPLEKLLNKARNQLIASNRSQEEKDFIFDFFFIFAFSFAIPSRVELAEKVIAIFAAIIIYDLVFDQGHFIYDLG